ncbi:MAG: gamma-glutamyltransferase [Bacteroidota bacterium]
MKGVIAAGHAATAQAGLDMFAAGGNAFDAALAATLMSFVAEPSLTSLGGGGFMTAVPAGASPTVYDFFVQTPRQRRPLQEVDFLASEINFGTAIQRQYIGKGSAAVPGCPAGVWQAHQHLGKLPFTQIAQPAIEACKNGIKITPYQAYTLSILEPILLHSPEMREIFDVSGRLIQAGETMHRPKLAETLQQFAREGADIFYKGSIGQAYAADESAYGGNITLPDLEAYQVVMREPVRCKVGAYELLTNAPPSAGGSMIAFGLKLLANLAPLPAPDTKAYVRCMADVMRAMDHFRATELQSRTHPAPTPQEFLDDGFVARFQPGINWLGNTTHISVLDETGNAASVTTTLGGASGHTIPGTGILTNNMLGEVDLHPGGMYEWGLDQRVVSMMSPSILLKDDQPFLILGTGGSSRIRTAILQVLANVIFHDMPVQMAVESPRLHWESHHLNLEPGLVEQFESLGMDDSSCTQWPDRNMFFGGVHSVVRMPDGRLDGTADSRRDGSFGRYAQ